jgi:hypothetical protein
MTGKSLELSARKLAGNRETTAGRCALQPLVNGGRFTGTCYATRQPTRSSFVLKGLVGRTPYQLHGSSPTKSISIPCRNISSHTCQAIAWTRLLQSFGGRPRTHIGSFRRCPCAHVLFPCVLEFPV